MPGPSKKSSQTAFDGTITRRLPSRTMLTSLTLSGNARLLGKRTACERVERKRLGRVITTSAGPRSGAFLGYVNGILRAPRQDSARDRRPSDAPLWEEAAAAGR